MYHRNDLSTEQALVISAFHDMDDGLFPWQRAACDGLALLCHHQSDIHQDVWDIFTDDFYDRHIANHPTRDDLYHVKYSFRRTAEYELFKDGEYDGDPMGFGVPIWDL